MNQILVLKNNVTWLDLYESIIPQETILERLGFKWSNCLMPLSASKQNSSSSPDDPAAFVDLESDPHLNAIDVVVIDRQGIQGQFEHFLFL